MTICPTCEAALEGIATYCHVCEEYVAEMGSAKPVEPASTSVPDNRLEDARRMAVRQTLDNIPGTARWPNGFVVLDFEQSRKGTRVRKGVADLYIMGFGVSAWVEMKTDKGVQSPDQIDFEADCVACGSVYFVWRHEGQASEWGLAVREAHG